MSEQDRNGQAPNSLAIKDWDNAYARLIKETVLKAKDREASDLELAFFAEQVKATGLNPIRGQIFGVYRWDSQLGREAMSIQVGIEGLRLLAERTGRYEGQTPVYWCGPDGAWTDVWLASEHPAAAKVGVYKAGFREPMWAVAKWDEYVQTKRDGAPTAMWKRMPGLMLGKCAESLALRKAFPSETSGLHTEEEMAQSENHAQTPSGGVVALPAGEPAAEHETREITADPPQPTEAAATAGQRRKINVEAAKLNMPDEALRELLRSLAPESSGHLDRLPKAKVDEVLAALDEAVPFEAAEAPA